MEKKIPMLTEIEATYQVTTPMFCGGADPARAELRLPSFKGVLRFWWRALAWPRLDGDLKAIKCEEDKLFGSADGGQSHVLMRLKDYEKPKTNAGHSLRLGPGARYLGYGVMERNPERYYLTAPFEFTVRMRGRDLDPTQLSSLEDAIITLGALGGIGARSRKGYGSLMLRSLTVDGKSKWNAPQSTEKLRPKVKNLLFRSSPDGLPAYTAVSMGARCLLVEGVPQPHRGRRQTPMELLDQIGLELKDAVTEVDGGQRIAFGLPRASRGALIPDVERRASPLFIHIHQCGDTPVAVLSFLPARFLPGYMSGVPEEGELYQPISDFLDRLTTRRDQLRVVDVRP